MASATSQLFDAQLVGSPCLLANPGRTASLATQQHSEITQHMLDVVLFELCFTVHYFENVFSPGYHIYDHFNFLVSYEYEASMTW